MECEIGNKKAAIAAQKLATGALMKLGEVAALLDVAPITVHRLSLPSIRIGHSLRFDPKDVSRLIEQCKEPVIA
jgi:hypothetical protein